MAGLLAAALVVAAAAVVVVDQRRLHRETVAVQECLERGDEAARLADRRLSAMATYLAPARVPSAADAADLIDRLMAEAATDARSPVEDAAQACADVAVRAWHPGTEAARANVATYLQARLESLAAIAADSEAYGRRDDELTRLRERAFPSQEPRSAA